MDRNCTTNPQKWQPPTPNTHNSANHNYPVPNLQSNQNQTKNLKAYKKLSKENKTIIEARHQTKTMSTALNIVATYKKLSYKPLKTDKLAEKLQQAQETGLVKKELMLKMNQFSAGKPKYLSPDQKKKPTARFTRKQGILEGKDKMSRIKKERLVSLFLLALGLTALAFSVIIKRPSRA